MKQLPGGLAASRARIASLIAGWPRVLRENWLFTIVMAAGLALRVLAQIAYRPALLYIDTMKYLYNAYPGADPVGYKGPLKLILAVGNLGTVTAVQHLLGLAMAVVIYVILLGYSSPRWLAAVATAPVLLDAYQVQIEQTIMPDVWFEALIVAGLAVLLIRRVPMPGMRAVTAAGVVLGTSATVRQVGEILILPGLAYLVAVGGPWRDTVSRLAVFFLAFIAPIGAYMAGSLLVSGHFWLDSATPSLSSYGRMATAADCATLHIPSYERPLCPTARQRANGIDWLDHDTASPLKSYVAPPGMNRYSVIASFDQQVMLQQPARVIAAIAADGANLFRSGRTAEQDGTAISRWQFQTSYPSYSSWVMVGKNGTITFGLRLQPGSPVITRHRLDPSYGGRAQVDKPVASFLRSYQLGGGYTPGPLLALLGLAGLAGSVLVLARRAPQARHQAALGCLLFFGTGIAVLAISDAFQFSWRYQLPALVTLPPAGVLGITALLTYLRRRGRADTAAMSDDVPDERGLSQTPTASGV
ncbi:MAG TPA: hypothetical protein VLX31_13975 [Streptosporangiaceae bacterium]|nr:hypothetical protein [Streptosporangiaceae bacterium]